MPPLPPITQALLITNTVVFCIQLLLGFGFERAFALWPLDGGFLPWQVVSYAFLHGSFAHLFFNMFGVWMFGGEIERVWGPRRFMQFYAVSVLAAAAAQLITTLATGSPNPTIGASGGLFGLLLAYAVMFPNRMIMLLIPPVPIKAKWLVAIYGGIELAFGVFNPNSGVAHFAHLGGALGGWLMIRYWRGQAPFGSRR